MQTDVIEPKPGVDVGRIFVDLHLENVDDLGAAALGYLRPDQVRSLDVRARVDTGCTYVGLSTSDIKHLGLRPVRRRSARTAVGMVVQQICSAVRVTTQGRDCLSEVSEWPDGSPALLGYQPLQALDFWIDMKNERLVGNPEDGGEWMVDM